MSKSTPPPSCGPATPAPPPTPRYARVQEAPFYRDLVAQLTSQPTSSDSSTHPVHLSGLVEGSRALLLTLLARRLRKRILLVLRDDVAMGAWHRDLEALALGDPAGILDFPAMDADPYDDISPHPEVVRERVIALNRICAGEVDFLLAPARALASVLPSMAEWKEAARTIRTGDDLPPDRFVPAMIGYGYKRVDTVSAQGEISRRGGIIDLFPCGAEEPVRIELFGDTVDSLRTFDTDHQRSTGKIEALTFGPALECPPTANALARVGAYLQDAAATSRPTSSSAPSSSPSVPPTATAFLRRLEQLQSEGFFPGFESLASIAARDPSDLFDYLPGFLVVVDEPSAVEEELVRADYDRRRCYEESRNRVLPPPDRLYIPPDATWRTLAAAPLTLQELTGEEPEDAGVPLTVATRSAPSYAGRVQELVADLKAALASGGATLCLMRTAGSTQRLQEILREYDVAPGEAPGGGRFRLELGRLRHGFEFPEAGFTLLTETEIFGREKKRGKRPAGRRGAFLSDFRDLKEGDWVVHVDHGIATYAGLGRPTGGSLNRDFMVLTFAGGDRLFVPVDRLDLVQKYSGVAGKKPVLDRLGGPGWQRVRAKAKKAVEAMARQLLELYARRKSVQGHRFAEDTPWQGELEDSFPWELTPDQERVVEEVKGDMESSRPMDRLLVGDVGFGKTEVAVRAAFKAVMDGKQVAVLAPTTVLAFQHSKTFRQRYAPFPVTVELVSRFRSATDVRKVLEKVETGEVDVLIGTHRIFSKDVRFRDLGLLVIDEEQRFGVAHKEKLKRISVGVDVLSMTATPIPRTLQMSLAGVRDLSIIETPPPGRMSIQTRIIPWRTSVLAQAVRQELRRNGQVFLVHNRIETLPALVRAVNEMVPEGRVAMAHGQMREHRLEQVMLRFVNYEVDILVTTTIIENGLDIPRANTIIVNRADRFGLAQLYQLRGRVGRSEKHAYAYFTIPGRESLSEVARKRLRALQEFGDLGAGFRLAAADLEIRGAGELLGPKQHGHIAALGFDLYCRMLEKTVAEMQGEAEPERPPVSVHLGVDIKLPESYLPDAGERLSLYKRLAGKADEEEISRLEAETRDRYGRLPAPGRNLFDMARLRLELAAAGVQRVDAAEGTLQLRFRPDASLNPERVVAIFRESLGRLTPSGLLILPAPSQVSRRIGAVRDILSRLEATAGSGAGEG